MTIKDINTWWGSLGVKPKAVIMRDRMTKDELKRQKYLPRTPDQFWDGKSDMEKENIHQKFSQVYITTLTVTGPKEPKQKKSSRSNKTKRK